MIEFEHRRRVMARKAARRTRRSTARPAAPAGTPRQRIIDAFMALLAEQPIERIGLRAIAEGAGVSLADLRGEFASPFAVLAAHVKDLDRAVLSQSDPDMEDETPRDRLFDVLMRRLDLLAPHREAVRSLMRSARGNPPLALALNAMAVRSMQWMLTAANISANGPKGIVRSQGLALLFANVLRTWIDDDDDNTRTLAALDRELTTGQRLAGLLDDLCRIPEAACKWRQRMREGARRGGRRSRRDRGVRDDERLAM
jgi:AcrR family transcriptional regulator